MNAIDFNEMYKKEREKMLNNLSNTNTSIFEKRERLEIKKYELKENLYYIDNFISEKEEQALLQEIYKNKDWISLSNRRLMNLGGTPHIDGMIQEDLPKYIVNFSETLEQSLKFSEIDIKFNQVLLNEYSNGKGIDYHKDGPLYKPLAVIISLISMN